MFSHPTNYDPNPIIPVELVGQRKHGLIKSYSWIATLPPTSGFKFIIFSEHLSASELAYSINSVKEETIIPPPQRMHRSTSFVANEAGTESVGIEFPSANE